MQQYEQTYTLARYGQMEPFSSFLPGVAGELGVPMWCYYVNRGQCVTSFGVEDKNHAIMEFFPAHQAYQYTQRNGFRTFIKLNGSVVEPFSDATTPHSMHVGMNSLTIEDTTHGLRVEVSYFTLPETRLAALVRTVTVTNVTDAPVSFDMLDGLPALLPYGMTMYFAKEMTQTAKAWLQAEHEGPLTFYAPRASMEDTSDVSQVAGVNFAAAITSRGEALPVFVDPRHVFAYDTALGQPVGFAQRPYAQWAAESEVQANILPACFCGRQVTLAPGESCSHDLVIGQGESRERVRSLCRTLLTPDALRYKQRRAAAMTQELTRPIHCRTADPVFDQYCRQTYLDNLLRGGTPVTLPGGKVVYLYSRKHGDPERDYNAFRMRPEYYSQGNGNFRDVNQNRRCDVLFTPQVGRRNIHMFYSLMQADGYNPLVVEYVQYTLPQEAREPLLALVESPREAAEALFARPFTPGMLRMAAEDWQLSVSVEDFFARVLQAAREGVAATFGEGYWTDHWTYDLDQIEAFSSVFPEEEEDMLYDDATYTWYRSPEGVLPRAQRYVVTERGVRQYRHLHPLTEGAAALCSPDGQTMTATLMEKLITLLAVKTSTLDGYGMGVEMEAGKPGWYDALNGLPGLLGSSMPETLELARTLEYVIARSAKYGRSVEVMAEVAALARRITGVLTAQEATWRQAGAILPVWHALSDAREAYRAQLVQGVSGDKVTLSPDEIARMLGVWQAFVCRGVEKALAVGSGLCPTYFAYDVTDYHQDEAGLHVTGMQQRRMPDFLEGQVRYLRLRRPESDKRRLTAAVRASRLYDQKLHMFKVNAALGEASYEIGRAHAFTPGWLENESVWLHMEYKYLLELLRSGLQDEFVQCFHEAAVPFLDPAVYGRSPLENSSFIASSANPDPLIHGKGFVARLSGSTAELLSIWQIMLLGETLFTIDGGRLTLHLTPLLPDYLTRGTDTVEATLLGKTRVVYHIQPGRNYLPGHYAVARACITWQSGEETDLADGVIAGDNAQRVRRQEAQEIHLWLR